MCSKRFCILAPVVATGDVGELQTGTHCVLSPHLVCRKGFMEADHRGESLLMRANKDGLWCVAAIRCDGK